MVLLAAIFILSLHGLRPPSPRPASAPAAQFSAARGFNILERLVGNGDPHPVGSDANKAVRDRILHEFEGIGYHPAVQVAFSCSDSGACGTVNNVVARLEGQDRTAVLLAAHYDSVPAGPGASDDAVGVAAAIEIARAVKSVPQPRHSIVFLIDDGEEGGLLGARAFVASHPWARDVAAAVNLDARGTSGPSLMFETGAANAWAAQLYDASVRHPATSSIFYNVYKRLPYDTDFTIFKAAGYQGLNFAFIGNVVQYHTALDDVATADSASMQHHGENALPTLLALANADFSRVPRTEAAYFDLFGRRVVCLSSRWMVFLSILSALLIALEIGLLFYTRDLALRPFLLGAGAWLAVLGAAELLGLILRRFLQLGGAMPVNWIAHPAAIETSFWFLGISAAITIAVLFARSAGFWGLWAGVWFWWALFSLIAPVVGVGVSYILLIPTAAAGVSVLPCLLRRFNRFDGAFEGWAVMAPQAASGLLGFPLALLLYDGLGNEALPAIAAFVALLFTPVLPLCVDFLSTRSIRGVAFFWIPTVVALATAFGAVLLPAYSAAAPERVNIEYWKDADTGRSQWILLPASGRLPEPIRLAAAFEPAPKGPFPWDSGPAFLAHAPAVDIPAPTFTILASTPNAGERRYRALLRSERGAPVVMALFPPRADSSEASVTQVSMNGQNVQFDAGRSNRYLPGWKIYRCITTPAEGVEISFAVPSGEAIEVYAVDASYALPPEGKFLQSARPVTATPAQDGDVTIVSRRVQLIP
jgi:hypothetical protein